MSEDDDAVQFGTVPSPCVRNCCLDEENVCLGCFRSIAEICAWHEASDAEKIHTLSRSRARYRQRYERSSNVVAGNAVSPAPRCS